MLGLATPFARAQATLTVLHSFRADGPTSLIQGTDGNFYGTGASGGAHAYGTVFKMAPSGTLTTLLSFNGSNGVQPAGALVQEKDGNFYGATYYGGASYNRTNAAFGTIFRLSLTASPPAFQTIARTGSTIAFAWSAVVGRSYQLQFTTNLTQPNWTNSGNPLTATNTTATASDTSGADRQRFYRVILLP